MGEGKEAVKKIQRYWYFWCIEECSGKVYLIGITGGLGWREIKLELGKEKRKINQGENLCLLKLLATKELALRYVYLGVTAFKLLDVWGNSAKVNLVLSKGILFEWLVDEVYHSRSWSLEEGLLAWLLQEQQNRWVQWFVDLILGRSVKIVISVWNYFKLFVAVLQWKNLYCTET